MGKKQSTTFHGRDVFAPAGAHIASGASILEAGPPAAELADFNFPLPEKHENQTHGHILYFDRYGNGLTNLLPEHLDRRGLAGLQIGKVFFPISETFARVEKDSPLSYWGSSGFLEVAIREGNARNAYHLTVESPVKPVYTT